MLYCKTCNCKTLPYGKNEKSIWRECLNCGNISVFVREKNTQFYEYNKIIIITWLISYLLTIYFVDYLKLKAYIIIPIISIILHICRYRFLFKEEVK